MNPEFDVFVDARQDDCPIPTIRTKDALDAMQDGEILKLVTTKKGTIKNIRTFVASNNCTLIGESKTQEGFIFLIKK